jgi:hypothetical protein
MPPPPAPPVQAPRATVPPVQMTRMAPPWRPNSILVMGLACALICWAMRSFWIGAWLIGPGW